MNDLKFDPKAITAKIKPVIEWLKLRAVPLFMAVVACVFGFLIWRIGQLANAEPSQDAIDEKLLTVVRPRLDPDSIKQIEDLRSQNIDIKSYFVDRANPFQE